MFEKLNYIELSGEKFPIWCGMEVLEQIQEKYEDISDFEKNLLGYKVKKDEKGSPKRDEKGEEIGYYGLPNIEMLNDALYWMVSAGLEIEAEQEKGELKKIERKHLLRKVDISVSELTQKVHDEFMRCFTRKNVKTA